MPRATRPRKVTVLPFADFKKQLSNECSGGQPAGYGVH